MWPKKLRYLHNYELQESLDFAVLVDVPTILEKGL